MNNDFKKILVWFRRDLGLYDNDPVFHALERSESVFCCFIFDVNILNNLKNKKDRRVEFIWESIRCLKEHLNTLGSDIFVEYGDPKNLIPKLVENLNCDALFINKDYEGYAIDRDNEVASKLLSQNNYL